MNMQVACETSQKAAPRMAIGNLFKRSEMTTAYLKMGIYGDAGSGKTYTASLVAKGLAMHIAKSGREIPPVVFIDTETGSSWVRPIFEEAGIEFFVAQTRSFADLKQAVVDAEQAGAILIVDSITHFWQEVQETYLRSKQERTRRSYTKLEFQDFAILKPLWAQFTSAYLNSKAHIILCGRAGGTYEYQENEETRKKELITTGTKMRAEKDMGYEPSLLVEMVIEKDPEDRHKKRTIRKAFVIKDRSTLLDGMEFANPTFTSFAPHIQRLNLGGMHRGFDANRNSAALFPKDDRDDRSLQRKIVLEEIENLLVLHFPSTGGADRKAKLEHLRECFQASWTEMERVTPLEDLRAGYDRLYRKLENKPSRYAAETSTAIEDEIPEFGAEAGQIPALEASRVLQGERPDGTPNAIRDEGAVFAAEQRAAQNFAKGDTRIPSEYRGTALEDAYCAAWEKVKAAAAAKRKTSPESRVIPNPPKAPANSAPSMPEPEPPADHVPSRAADGSPTPEARANARARGQADHVKQLSRKAVPGDLKPNKMLANEWRAGWDEAEAEAQAVNQDGGNGE